MTTPQDHYPIWRDVSFITSDEHGEFETYEEIEVCGTCVPKHSHFRSRAEVPGWPCESAREAK